MKNRFTALLAFISAVLGIMVTTASAAEEFPHVVPFELGDAEFSAGDRITVTEVRGTAPTLITNETYCVTGTYSLSSRDEAELSFYVTVPNSGPTRVDPKQTVRVTKGAGTFRLIKTMHAEGYPHISFYPRPSGSSFGGVYFGQGEWVLRNKGWSTLANQQTPSGANQAIFQYLGEPVAPPPNLDPAYSREALLRTVHEAAHRSGLAINSIRLDESEFPFLIGLVSTGDFDRLGDELKKMDGYDFTGSVGHQTYHAFNIIPWRVFPPEHGQRIGRRLTVRMQILADKISGL